MPKQKQKSIEELIASIHVLTPRSRKIEISREPKLDGSVNWFAKVKTSNRIHTVHVKSRRVGLEYRTVEVSAGSRISLIEALEKLLKAVKDGVPHEA
jgi:hypothetical protein